MVSIIGVSDTIDAVASAVGGHLDADVDAVVAVGQQAAVHAAACQFGDAEIIRIQAIQPAGDEGPQFEPVVGIGAITQ